MNSDMNRPAQSGTTASSRRCAPSKTANRMIATTMSLRRARTAPDTGNNS
jgi:hypothetical protein